MFKRLLLAMGLALSAPMACAQSTFPTPQSSTGGPSVGGQVGMCLNASGQAVPCGGATTPAVVTPSTNVPTYSAGFDITGYATPTDLWSICGSSTKTVRVRRVELSGTATTSTSVDVALIMRSTADTGGTPTALTKVPMDASNAASTAALNSYGSAPTLGTTIGDIRDAQLTLPPAASSTPALTYLVWDFGGRGQQPPALHGAAQCLAFNFFGAALPAGMKISTSVEWTEE